MYIGWPVLSISRTTVRSDCGQASIAPSGVADQSLSRILAPISPPPAVARRVLAVWREPSSSKVYNPDRYRASAIARGACAKHLTSPNQLSAPIPIAKQQDDRLWIVRQPIPAHPSGFVRCQSDKDRAFDNLVACLGQDHFDDAVECGRHGVFHLHGFEHHEALPLSHGIALGDMD